MNQSAALQPTDEEFLERARRSGIDANIDAMKKITDDHIVKTVGIPGWTAGAATVATGVTWTCIVGQGLGSDVVAGFEFFGIIIATMGTVFCIALQSCWKSASTNRMHELAIMAIAPKSIEDDKMSPRELQAMAGPEFRRTISRLKRRLPRQLEKTKKDIMRSEHRSWIDEKTLQTSEIIKGLTTNAVPTFARTQVEQIEALINQNSSGYGETAFTIAAARTAYVPEALEAYARSKELGRPDAEARLHEHLAIIKSGVAEAIAAQNPQNGRSAISDQDAFGAFLRKRFGFVRSTPHGENE